MSGTVEYPRLSKGGENGTKFRRGGGIGLAYFDATISQVREIREGVGYRSKYWPTAKALMHEYELKRARVEDGITKPASRDSAPTGFYFAHMVPAGYW